MANLYANEAAFRDWKLTGAQSHVARSRKRRTEGRTQLGLAHLDAAARHRTSLLTAPRYQFARALGDMRGAMSEWGWYLDAAARGNRRTSNSTDLRVIRRLGDRLAEAQAIAIGFASR